MHSSESSSTRLSPKAQFATTQWSLIVAAGQSENQESTRALEKLCRAYWPPLYAYVRRRVDSVHEAQDLTQAFFERLLEKKYLEEVDPERGRFRAFLITAFKHFLSKEWDKARAEKRGGGHTVFSFDFASQEAMSGNLRDNLTPERIYERQWAVTLLGRVMGRLQREAERSGKASEFHVLKDFIGGSGASPYAVAAESLAMSESAARMAASRLRKRYRELLREEIAETVTSGDDIDDEVRHLFATFSD